MQNDRLENCQSLQHVRIPGFGALGLDAVAFSLDQGLIYSGRDCCLGHRLHERI
jgi:hypothetical protein